MDNIEAADAIVYLVGLISAIGALGTAAFGLVDASKALRGGVSNIGFGDLERVLDRFERSLDRAVGKDEWRDIVYANWISGMAKNDQKAIVKSLIRLGLDEDTAPELAQAGHVRVDDLRNVAKSLATGEPLLEKDLNVLGRMDASIEARLDAAFNRAEQHYRSWSRLVAGIVAVVLPVLATAVAHFEIEEGLDWRHWTLATAVGVLAVPLAPIAKDVASSLSAAAHALKAARGWR